MNLDNIPSRRSPWQSVDVGLSIHQKWSYQAWMLTLLVVTPIYLILRLISIFIFDAFEYSDIFGNFVIQVWVMPVYLILEVSDLNVKQGYFRSENHEFIRFCLANLHIVCLIWLKPIYERISMLLFSKKLFGEDLNNKALYQLFLNSLKRSVILDLTWRRLSPYRFFTNPINILEGQKGKARNKRINNLMNTCSSTLFMVFFALVGLELFIIFGLVVLYWMFSSSYEISYTLIILMDIFTLLVFTYFASLASAIGFGLYINQRNQLEAWDIEKSISKALLSLKSKSKYLTPIVIVLIMSFHSDQVHANSQTNQLTIEERMIEAQQDELFHKIEVIRELKDQPKKEKEIKPQAETREINFAFGAIIGDIFQALVLLCLAVAIIIVLLKYRHAIQNFTKIERKQKLEVFDSGLNITKESLPKDVVSTAKRHFDNNEIRQGLSLLYRAALSSLYYDFQIEFERSDTEQNCLSRATVINNKELVAFFKELTKLWINFAYGHISLEQTKQEYLIQNWAKFFRNEEADNGK